MRYDFYGKKCLVYGTGISGKAAAGLLIERKAYVVLYDENEKADAEAIGKSFDDNEGRLRVICGELPTDIRKETELIVLSPGVPLDNPTVKLLSKEGIDIIGEIELAWLCSKGDVLAITGTNGKTTTTALLGEIMKAYVSEKGSGKAFVVGNIGEPYTAHAEEMQDDSITVAEISSFQLETVKSFKPKVSAVLNLTPDHLNRHYTMENYAAVKKRIMEFQDEEDTVVLNFDDPYTRDMAGKQRAKVVFFSGSEEKRPVGFRQDFVLIKDSGIYYNERRIMDVSEVKLLGRHNLENVMAAIGMAVSYGVSDDIIRKTVSAFRAVEHRIEFVRNVDGVDYYNDSKGTNPDAAIKAVEAMVKPAVLIGGGYDKKSSYDEFIESFNGKVKLLVLIGETAEAIKECAVRHGFTDILMASDLQEAVKLCHGNAENGDCVLLSPACASWDMFKNYEERGRLFKEYVNSL